MSTTFAPVTTILFDGERGPAIDETHPLAVNVTSMHAALILNRLGYALDTGWGIVPAADFLGRAMVANVGRSDDGTGAATDGMVTDAGLRPGYFTDVMQRLCQLATACENTGQEVGWC